jgi:HD-like signal output (HDOD) protein
MDPTTVRNRIECVGGLTTIPGVAKQALELVGSPSVSITEIGHLVGNDPALASKILKMINSALYGFPQRISSINQAVLLLGLNAVRGLLLSVTVFDLMKNAMVGLWEHSIGAAIVARLIARKKSLRDPEDVSIYGLVHDIGKIALALQYPEEYENVLNETKRRGTSILSAETEYFSVDHAMVGGWVAEHWGFPADLVEVIRYHHRPRLARNMKVETGIAHLADIILRARGFGFAGDNMVPPVDPAAWELIDLAESDVHDILNEMEDLLEEAEELAV